MPKIQRSAMHVTSASTARINEEGSDDMAEHRVRKITSYTSSPMTSYSQNGEMMRLLSMITEGS